MFEEIKKKTAVLALDVFFMIVHHQPDTYWIKFGHRRVWNWCEIGKIE